MLSRFRHVRLFATPWTVAHQASLSMGFPREEYWSGFPFPSPGNLSDPGIKPVSLEFPCFGRCNLYHSSKSINTGNSVVGQWLGLDISTTGGMGSIPGQGTKMICPLPIYI